MNKIEILEQAAPQLTAFLDEKIAEFNWANWEVSERLPIAAQLKDEAGHIIAGAAGRTFGNWLMLNTLWVSEALRGQNIGSQLLTAVEEAARKRGCKWCLLDTLNFQAKPFYEKQGYQVQWSQDHYPKTGARYYMVKTL
ncbi:Acetyltransferase (GNAT) family protein [Oceanospirillum multiglobuliferum]|uniref:GNAT family N-acetyltransferase n=1 Tax=Oceanospirillum multiglobuliferum TaxID=64969 RepID=A0A1T4N729_9GAMM|nr:GNAT family N-acetyltransferase [Oceanospirillum multiglobuliferum]OPX55863.1 GNAT family N-acetyltransferase [Oceanospirillum multiglobuliferum]SJZ75120.1 Acetyltransferase (GNAT) family protein [Oceanospirillum multiglobuliferum]